MRSCTVRAVWSNKEGVAPAATRRPNLYIIRHLYNVHDLLSYLK